MPDDYDTIVGQVMQAGADAQQRVAEPVAPPPQPAPPEIHPAYDAFAENTVDRLRVSTSAGIVQDPARAGRIRSLQARTGLPADLIDRNLDTVEQDAKAATFDPDAYRRSSPKVAAWLAQQPEHLAISLDDLPRLAAVERFIADSPDYAWDKGGSILGPKVGNNRTYYRSTADLLAAMREQQNLAVVDDVQRTMRAEAAQDRGAFAAGFINSGGSTLRLVQTLAGRDTGGLQKQLGQIAEASAINDPGFWADVRRGLGGFTADAPLMLAGAALAPLTRIKAIMGGGKLASYGAGAAAAGIASQPLAIREGILTGQDEGWANGLGAWGIETVVPTLFGTTGSERLISTLAARGVPKAMAPTLARAAGRLLLDAGWEATEEAVTELAHAVHEVGSGMNPAALDPANLWPRLGVAATVGGIAGGGFNLPSTIAGLARRGDLDREANRLLQAASGQQILEQVIQTAADASASGRSPEAAAELFQTLVDDKVPQVYVDREAWDAHHKAQNKDPRAEAIALMGDAKAYDEAARTGAPLIFQTGAMAVGVAKDKATAAWIAQEARLDPGMMNAREAKEYVAALETVPDDPDQKVAQTAQEAAQAVQDDVEQQLVAAGYDTGSARRNAAQMGAFFRTMAARWNAGRKADDPSRTDAKQLYQEWNVGINRPTPEILAMPGGNEAGRIIAERRAKMASASTPLDAERIAAQETADQALAQTAASDAGFALIQEATAVLEAQTGTLSAGDAMLALGPAFGFRPDSTAAITDAQRQRGNLFAAAMRVRGKSLADLLMDAGVAKPAPVATTAAAEAPPSSPELEKLAASALRLVSLVDAIRAGKGDLAEMEAATALAQDVAPAVDSLPLTKARIEDVRAAVEFAQDKSYNQPGKSTRRGSITFGRIGDQKNTPIRLFESANLSTFLHESGHLYLGVLTELATREGAPQDIKDDLAKALEWLGVKSVADIKTEQHEQWARGMEAYFMEGKAPSAELRGVFARFAAWLGAIYKQVKALAVELNPEVRGVMDRLLATQEEIAEARQQMGDLDPLFADAKAAGMTDTEFASYQAARAEATQRATDELRTQAMREITREQTAAWKEIRAEVASEVELEVNRNPAYVAESILRRGTLPGGVPLPKGMPPIKLDTADLKRRLPAGVSTKAFFGMHTKEGGIAVDQAAKLLGFDSADALLTSVSGLRNRRQMIEAETDVRMRSRFGDMLTDGTIAEKAMAALHNEKKADVHLAEVKALATRVGKKAAPIEVLRAAAQRKIGSLPIKDILPQIYARAEAKARRTLENALAKQDFDAAWKAKQQELLNHELYRAAIDAKREAEAIVERAKKYTEQKTRDRIGKAGGWEWTVTAPDGKTATFTTEAEAKTASDRVRGSTYARTSGYLEKIDALLGQYEFRRVSDKALARRETLREWAAKREAEGLPVPIPDAVLNAGAGQRNYKTVPLSELRAVNDTLVLIATLAKNKNKLLAAEREEQLDATAARLAGTLKRTHPTENQPDAGATPGNIPAFIAAHRKAANIAREMDGDEDNGDFWNELIRPMNEAADAEAARLRDAKVRQEALWKAWSKATANDGWPPGERREFDGFKGGLTRMSAILVALNWGNEGNRQRLLEGGQGRGPLTDPQVQAVLDSLNAADWDLVEGVWDHIDSYWSDIAALEQRMTGTAPEKVDASPFPTKHGTIKGGYFPIIYDGQETGRIDGDSTDLAKQIQAQAYGTTTTSRGHTKERTIGQGRRLNLDPGVIGSHLTRVIHDLTHRAALSDVMRVLMHDDVRTAIDRRMGSATTRTLRQWIADIATGGQPPDAVARTIGQLRKGFSISTMGFRAMTAALQLTGFSNSAVRVGPARMLKAIGTLFSRRDGEAAWNLPAKLSSMMELRASTMTREINETIGQFQRGKMDNFQAAVGAKAFWLMGKMQGIVDRATWLAAYEKAIDEGHEADAVAIANQTVLDTQSGGQTKDLSGVARSPYAQILTGAYTYGSLVFNQLYDQGARIKRNPKDFGTWAGAFGNMMLAAALPAAMSVALRALLRNDWPDDEDKDGIGRRYANEMASTILGTMVGFRELGGAISGFDYSGPGVTKPFADMTRLGKQALQGEADIGLARAILDTMGSAIGLPSGQLWATLAGGWELIENPDADIRAPIFGPPPRR